MRGGEPFDPAALRVLQVIPVLAQGGLESMASLLAVGLRGRVAHVAIAGRTGVGARHGGPAVEGPLREVGIPLHHITRPRQSPRPLAQASLGLARVLRAVRPDVIHAHNPAAGTASLFARALARLPDAAIVTTYHGVPPGRIASAARALRLSSDIVVGVGPTSLGALERAGVPARRTAVVYNAVEARPTRPRAEMRAELGVPEDAELVVNVGRYEEPKNQALLIDALAALIPRRPRLHALVVGMGSLEDDLRERVREHGIADRVRIAGAREDPLDVMAAADVFALSSSWEALPLVLIEAMIAGAAVVTTDVGGVADVARDGETGLVVPPNDAAALAAAVARLLDDGALRATLTAAAGAFVRTTCSPPAMVDGYVRVYVDAVDRRRKRSSPLRAGARPSK